MKLRRLNQHKRNKQKRKLINKNKVQISNKARQFEYQQIKNTLLQSSTTIHPLQKIDMQTYKNQQNKLITIQLNQNLISQRSIPINQILNTNKQTQISLETVKQQTNKQQIIAQQNQSYLLSRSKYIQETRMDCEDLFMNWESYALIIYYSDVYFSLYPFNKKSREECFAIFVIISSKITEKINLQMKAFIEHIKLKDTNYEYFKELQKIIIKRLEFRLCPKTFPKIINEYINLWDHHVKIVYKESRYTFLQQNQASYIRYRFIHYMSDVVLINRNLDDGTIKSIIKIVMKQQMSQIQISHLLDIIMKDITQITLKQQEIKWIEIFKNNRTKILAKYEQRKKYQTYAQFLTLYYATK